MKKLLHIIATPRGNESRTLKISNTFIEFFQNKHPEWAVDELNLYKEELPSLSTKTLDGKYILLSGGDLSDELKKEWANVLKHIERFLSADAYLLSAPMWNFSIPYQLKHYLDIIVQPKFLFRYTPKGAEGLVKNKQLLLIASRGGDYNSANMHKFDFQEPYLRAIFNFIGIDDFTSIIAQPMDMGYDLQQQNIIEAQSLAIKLAANFPK